MLIDIASLKRSLFGSEGESATSRRADVERAANALVSGDDAQMTVAKLATATRTLDGNNNGGFPYQFVAIYGGSVAQNADVNLDDLVEEALTADLSVDELVQRRKQIA